MTVYGLVYHVHPEALENVIPGQFVTLQYNTEGGAPWATGIFPGFRPGVVPGAYGLVPSPGGDHRASQQGRQPPSPLVEYLQWLQGGVP